MADDDDRPRDASSAADGGWADDGLSVDWVNAAAPDDIRELSADVRAYRREQRAVRRELIARRLTTRLGMRPLSLVAIVLVLTAAVATMIVIVLPGASRGIRAAPLAKTTAAPTNGGLIPADTLHRIDGTAVSSRSLRPSLIALAPVRCGCFGLLKTADADARASHVQFIAVSPNGDAELASEAGTFGEGRSEILYDVSGALRNGPLRATGLTFVVVNPNGTVATIKRSVTAATIGSLKAPLAHLLSTSEPPA